MSPDSLLIASLRKREEEQRRLIAITNALVAEVEPATLFATIDKHLRALYAISAFGIVFYNPAADLFERGTLVTGTGSLRSIEPIPRRDTLLESLCAAGTGRVMTPSDVDAAIERFLSLRDARTVSNVSAVLLPMYTRSRHILAVAAALGTHPDTFSEEELPFLNQLAAQIGLAIENMQAYREIASLRLLLEREGTYLKEEIRESFNHSNLIFASAAMAGAMRTAEKAAGTDATVLLMGETGTGKELFARAIHARSAYADRALVKVNCGAIPPGLIESHLFGHEKGAFTGAVNQHIGVFEVANGGTLFLDEIGELPLDVQVKLLRVLQEGEVTRVGGRDVISVRTRVIAATNRVLEAMVDDGTFRADLYYRLAVVPLTIPPLRERRDDIPLLATFFVNRYAERFRKPLKHLTSDALKLLEAYSFPGNVRELENMIERAVVLSDGKKIGPELFLIPDHAQTSSRRPALSRPQSEKEEIIAALKELNGIIEGPRGAARRLKMNPSTLRSKMARFGIRR